MLNFAQQPPSKRPALRSIGGGKPAALDTPEKTLQACLEAGVELQVSGVEEGTTGLVLRRKKSSTGEIPADLRGAIRRHKTAMIARLLGDMPIDENPVRDTKPEWSRNKTLSEVWGETALQDQAKYEHRGARLYSHIDEQVWTPKGNGKLINVLGGEARVLIDRDVSRAVDAAAKAGKKKPKLATVDFEIGKGHFLCVMDRRSSLKTFMMRASHEQHRTFQRSWGWGFFGVRRWLLALRVCPDAPRYSGWSPPYYERRAGRPSFPSATTAWRSVSHLRSCSRRDPGCVWRACQRGTRNGQKIF